MKSRTPYLALRSYPKDDSVASAETFNMGPHKHASHEGTANEYNPTFCEKGSRFPWKTFLIISTLPLALAPIVVLAAAAEALSQNYIRGRDCYPNGKWKEEMMATWEIMDSSYFFTPNLSFGAMTFTQAKVIDVAWDLIIGRGGQILLAWVNYRVFNEWLVYHMEIHLTSYKMYAAIAFETTTMRTLGVLGKEFLAFGESSWKRFLRWLAIISMFLSTLYVLSFPTLMGAMTGYITTYKPYIEDREGNLIEWSRIASIEYVINDAPRIGFDKPLIVVDGDTELLEATKGYLQKLDNEAHADANTLTLNVLSRWEFEGNVTELDKPSLNITRSLSGYKSSRKDVSELTDIYYTIMGSGRQGELYERAYVLDHGSCKHSETYQWGFSYIFLFMISIFQFIWSCTMVGLWLDTRYQSRMYKSGRRPGFLRSIMDLSAAIRDELGTQAENLSEEELRRQLRDSGGALMVPKGELKIATTRIGDGGISKRTWRSNVTRGSTF